ncbi:hypothetical protein [Commensalibacter nepenthis]|uniref:Uncharacterized protein n=1 Tax=Commensalibacter nepenthis TaxID=3043872 RepID=A0ABT6Q9M7_9PROT|nr:hypothetical protein [Commensalibacter sp. TBRC 10068]MDI2112923.1 hypothetical protein [Commensalibacter sp. TBRC 10068]
MDFYTGKPDRAIKHFGIIHYTYETSQAVGLMKAITNAFRYETDVKQQSDEDALLAIENLVLERKPNANVVYDMNVSMVHIPIQGSYCIITKIFASYGAYQDVW